MTKLMVICFSGVLKWSVAIDVVKTLPALGQ